jgi:hypothetical protein
MKALANPSIAAAALAAFFVIGMSIPCLSLAQNHHTRAPRNAHHIIASEATKVALARYPGKVVGRVVLENEDGKMQYSVNIRSGKTLREVMVDAKTGKIASVEKTSAKEEAREAAAEKKHSKHGFNNARK